MYLGGPMNAWKSSTLLVLGAFTVSVVLLLTKAGMYGDRRSADAVVVSNHIYSPAAADPNLRSPERADRLRRSAAKPVAASLNQTATPKPARRKPAPAPKPTPKPAAKATAAPTAPAPTAAAAPTAHAVPAGHVFYVVAATFSSKENGERGLAQMRRKGLDKAFLGTFDEGKFYSVIADTYAKESSARYMVKELADKHQMSAYVYHKKD